MAPWIFIPANDFSTHILAASLESIAAGAYETADLAKVQSLHHKKLAWFVKHGTVWLYFVAHAFFAFAAYLLIPVVVAEAFDLLLGPVGLSQLGAAPVTANPAVRAIAALSAYLGIINIRVWSQRRDSRVIYWGLRQVLEWARLPLVRRLQSEMNRHDAQKTEQLIDHLRSTTSDPSRRVQAVAVALATLVNDLPSLTTRTHLQGLSDRAKADLGKGVLNREDYVAQIVTLISRYTNDYDEAATYLNIGIGVT